MRARRGERRRCNGGQEKGKVYTQKIHTCGQTTCIGEHEVENGTISSFSSRPCKDRLFPCSLVLDGLAAAALAVLLDFAIRGSLSLGEDSWCGRMKVVNGSAPSEKHDGWLSLVSGPTPHAPGSIYTPTNSV